MKKLNKIGTIIFYTLLAVVLLSALGMPDSGLAESLGMLLEIFAFIFIIIYIITYICIKIKKKEIGESAEEIKEVKSNIRAIILFIIVLIVSLIYLWWWWKV